MHYFGSMAYLKKINPLTLMVLAAACLIAAWTWNWGIFLLIPGFVMAVELAHREKYSAMYLFVCFALWNAGTTYWIANSHPLGVVATVGINGALMAFSLWFGVRTSKMLQRLQTKKWITQLPIVASWMAFEQLHENWGLSFPWLNLGNTFFAWPELVQWYRWTGTVGGTLWVLLVALFIHGGGGARWKSVSLALPLVLSLVIWFIPVDYSSNPSVQVAVVQPNIDAYVEKWELPESAQINKVKRLLEEADSTHIDLIILPETFLPRAREEALLRQSSVDAHLINALKAHGTAALFGASTYDFQYEPNVYNRPYGDKYYTIYNSALFMSDPQQPWEVYHKGKLVVGGETMPFVKYLKPMLGDWAIELGGTSGTLGVSQERKVFENEALGLRIAPIICWENEFSDYALDYSRLDANLLAVITNDGWWGDTPGHVQHMKFSGLRAIEQGKYVVRSANTGISAVISSKGKVEQSLGWAKEGVLLAEVPLIEKRTLYVKTGNFLGPIMGILFLINVAVVLISRFFRLKPR